MVNIVFNGFVGSKDFLTHGFSCPRKLRQVNYLGTERLSNLPKPIKEITIPVFSTFQAALESKSDLKIVQKQSLKTHGR